MVAAGIALLGRKQGVGIEELTSSTGWWLPRTARAALIRVVIDNLSIHSAGALYDAFPAPEARRALKLLKFHHTPKLASWLNMVEIEIDVLHRQCLDRRIDNDIGARIAPWRHF